MTLPYGTFYISLHGGPENGASFNFRPPANRLIRVLHVTNGAGHVSRYTLACMSGLWLEYRYGGEVSMRALLLDHESNVNLINQRLLSRIQPSTQTAS